jgi:hypothetical protein
MKHPSPEELMEHLYGESSPTENSAMAAHLQACADCRRQTSTWRDAMKTLDGWPLPAPRARRVARPILRWAAAAAVLLGVGFLTGRSFSPDAKTIQAAIRQEAAVQVAAALQLQRTALADELRASVTQSMGDETRRLLTSVAEQLDDRRQSDAEVFYTALQQLDARHAQEVARLREHLSTVAVVANARFDDTEEQLLQLANAMPVANH